MIRKLSSRSTGSSVPSSSMIQQFLDLEQPQQQQQQQPQHPTKSMDSSPRKIDSPRKKLSSGGGTSSSPTKKRSSKQRIPSLIGEDVILQKQNNASLIGMDDDDDDDDDDNAIFCDFVRYIPSNNVKNLGKNHSPLTNHHDETKQQQQQQQQQQSQQQQQQQNQQSQVSLSISPTKRMKQKQHQLSIQKWLQPKKSPSGRLNDLFETFTTSDDGDRSRERKKKNNKNNNNNNNNNKKDIGTEKTTKQRFDSSNASINSSVTGSSRKGEDDDNIYHDEYEYGDEDDDDDDEESDSDEDSTTDDDDDDDNDENKSNSNEDDDNPGTVMNNGNNADDMMSAFTKQYRNETKQRKRMLNQYAKKETYYVTKWRIITFICILLSGLFLISSTIVILKKYDTNYHLQSYYLHVNTITDVTKTRVQTTQMGIMDVSDSVTAGAHLDVGFNYRRAVSSNNDSSTTNTTIQSILESNATTTSSSTGNPNFLFPYVTLQHYEERTKSIMATSQGTIEMITWIPFIHETQYEIWMNYTSYYGPIWYAESYYEYTKLLPRSYQQNNNTNSSSSDSTNTKIQNIMYKDIWSFEDIGGGYNTILTGNPKRSNSSSKNDGWYSPLWQTSPPTKGLGELNFDFFQQKSIEPAIHTVTTARDGVYTAVDPFFGRFINNFLTVPPELHQANHDQYIVNDDEHFYGPMDRIAMEDGKLRPTGWSCLFRPHSMYLQPIYDYEHVKIVGFVASIIAWDRYLGNVLSGDVDGIYAVLRNTCGQSYTYLLQGSKAHYVGEGDFHDPTYDYTEQVVPLSQYEYNETKLQPGHCVYTMSIYSSTMYEEASKSKNPMNFTIAITCIVTFVAISFCIFDSSVHRRNIKIVNAAVRSNKVVSSLFPSHVTNQLLADPDQSEKDNASVGTHMIRHSPMKWKGDLLGFSDPAINFTEHDDEQSVLLGSKPPIADLFTDTTIMFADIAGFTSWSSSREPTQVFILLETVYHAFDEIARKRRVYKVETVGDCYVAVAGLPNPRKDHAVAMCRFSKDILLKMRQLTQKLQRSLGPETEELALRVGLHSGPVTAGVLRGQNSRFQLFGDTMNTAARMEQNGVRDKIHISQETADLVVGAGKAKWIVPREDKIFAKGKGELDTYWLVLRCDEGFRTGSVSGTSSSGVEREFLESVASNMFNSKSQRLIEWNVDVLIRFLKQIVTRRNASPRKPDEVPPNEERYTNREVATFDEVSEIILLPKFDARIEMNQQDPGTVELDEKVLQQVHKFVASIASTYRDNPFHSFEHASHVTQSVLKLLSRVIAPSSVEGEECDEEGNLIVSADALHDHTYGITSDPLTQFACAFSSLIHDADHPGVPNAQLVKEKTAAAMYYRNTSVSEQNSVDLAWELLMQDDYKDFRGVIYQTDAELLRFRQLVVNCVMATDIVDKELKTLRNNRWDRAFTQTTDENEADATDRKATIVIEHLLQASDVAHTMQHWNIYRRWNEKFFTECYKAFLDGRAEKDPTDTWYQGEIGFFDFYIIPLAKKLKDCGVFGVSSAEYLDYATKNRQEWELRGQEVVGEMLEKARKKLNVSLEGIEFEISNSNNMNT